MQKMPFRRMAVCALGIALTLTLGPVTRVYADAPTLGIQLQENGYAPVTVTGSNNPLILSDGIGTFITNVEVNSLFTNPLSIDLGSINVSSLSAGALTILASATGLTSPVGLVGFLSQFSGNFFGAVASATLQTFISNSNTMFGMDTLLSSLSATGTPFATSASANAATGAPFAVTEAITIKTSGAAVLSMDASTTAAPEINVRSGGAAIALLLGMLALVSERRRRPAAS
jgi:hypothetical protein